MSSNESTPEDGGPVLAKNATLDAVVSALLFVVGVVLVTEARRLSDPPGGNASVLAMAPDEIAVCDDDASAPTRGRIELTIEGGR